MPKTRLAREFCFDYMYKSKWDFVYLILRGIPMCEMDSFVASVAVLSIMGDGKRLLEPPSYKGRVAAISACGAGRHMWGNWRGGVSKVSEP